LGEAMPSAESVKNLVKKVAHNYRLPYFTITPTFSICPKHGYLSGEHQYCPKCDAEMGIGDGEIENGAEATAVPVKRTPTKVSNIEAERQDDERELIRAIA
jgi:anaerobic ribonucleoside-triphosphate reductase